MTLETITGNEVRFFFDESRASHLMREMLSTLAKWEGSVDASTLFRLLPYVNLYPWLLVNEHMAAERFLSQYLCIVKPIITIAFSKRVASVLRRGFKFFGDFNGQKTSRFVEEVGTMEVVSYDSEWLDDETASGPPEGSFTIVIAHYDPGHDKYGEQHPLMRRMMLLCWMVTFVLMETAMTYMKALVTEGPSRRIVCEQIIQKTQVRLDAMGFTAALATARAQASEYLVTAAAARAQLRRPYTEDQRAQKRIKLAMTRMLAHAPFILKGAPYSAERQLHTEAIFALHRPEFGIHISYDREREWMEWVSARPSGTSLVTSVLAAITGQVGEEPQSILIRTLGLNPQTSKWSDPNAQELFVERLAKMRQAHGRFLQSEAGRRAQRERVLLRYNSNALYTVNDPLEGRALTCLRRKVSFYATIGTEVKHIQFYVPPHIRVEQPRLHFAIDGIHLKDDTDKDLGLVVSVHQMAYLETFGGLLLAVWQSEMEGRLGRPLTDEELPAKITGKSPPKYAPRRTSYPIKPIDQEDAIWVFRKWLDFRFPDRTNELRFHWQDPNSPIFEFLPWMQEEYPLHPSLERWRRIFREDGLTGSSIFRGCIIALRGDVTVKQQYYVSERYRGKVLKFGGPRPDEELE